METITIPAARDSYLSQVQDTTNFGAGTFVVHDVMYAGGTKTQWRRGIVNFDVSALAGGAQIIAAKLVRELTVIVNPGRQAILSRCTRPADWLENEVTWTWYRVGAAWTHGGGDYDDAGPPAAVTYTEAASTGVHELPGLAAFVTDALANRGGIVSLITRLADEDPDVTTQYGWHSREAGAQGWRLVIDYVPFSEPGHRSLVAGPLAAGEGSMRPAQPAGAMRPARPGRPARPAPPSGHASVRRMS